MPEFKIEQPGTIFPLLLHNDCECKYAYYAPLEGILGLHQPGWSMSDY